MQKAFQILLVTFVVIFTAAGLIILVYGLIPYLLSTSRPPGIGGFAFGISERVFRLGVALALFLFIGFVYFISRRTRLR